jgi:hypothetical protein
MSHAPLAVGSQAQHARSVVREGDLDKFSHLRRSAEGRAVPLPGFFSGSNEDLSLLALAFARGEAGALAVPYMRREGL